jgi:uncharacterized peroxidase-related enzyme
MSRIAAIDPTTTTGHVKELLDGVQKGLGVTPNLFRVAANSRATLEALTSLFGAVGKGRLGAKAREAIALTVSEIDACDYCLSAHTALGTGAGLTPGALEGARRADSDDARLAAILRFAKLVTERRGHVADEDLVALRKVDVSDAEIVEIVANVALTTFTNYLNEVASTDIDFPVVTHHAR